jgi:hypothetical protein
MHHALVVEDANVGLLLEEKVINVNDCRLSSTRRINEVKTCVDLPVKEARQLKLWLCFDSAPVDLWHHTRLKHGGLDAKTVTAQAKIISS